MKLNVDLLRYLTNDDFRVLTATEMGSRNHEVVPTPLIATIAQIRTSSVQGCISTLAKNNLIAKVQHSKYDGYRLTYGGYDYLALKTFANRGSVTGVGTQIGVGKESDIYIVADDDEHQHVLKIQRLGRTSFRNIKQKRDYLRNRQTSSWLYLSRLAAIKEYTFMTLLYQHGFPVPRPVDQNRHCVVMELIDAYPLLQIHHLEDPAKLYSTLMDLIVRLACAGLIHGDFNEFNILIKDDDSPILIDFPQMVSINHKNAQMYFDRDVTCIREFFRKRFQYESKEWPRFTDIVREGRLDLDVRASGFGVKEEQEWNQYLDDLEQDSNDTEESWMEKDESVLDENLNENNEELTEIPSLTSQLAELGIPSEQDPTKDRFGNDIAYEEEIEEEEEEDDEESDDLPVVENNSRPFRDPKPLTPQSTPTRPKKKDLTPDEIRNQVRKSLKTRTKIVQGNKCKSRVKRRNEEAVKVGKGIFDGW
jgi:RIO kinase 2